MELATIELPRAEARQLYLEYRDEVRQRHDAELEQIMRGYRALAKGHQVIDLVATMRAGGTVQVPRKRPDWVNGKSTTIVDTLPALAICRADLAWCWLHTSGRGEDASFMFTNKQEAPRANEVRHPVRLPAGTLPIEIPYSWGARHRALVPIVPPGLRPLGDLGRFHILWEADWEAVPVDPALLRHIGGDLYAVIAIWDLTDLERTVLAGRLR